MILSAALRLMRVDHLDTQKILFEVDADADDLRSGSRRRPSSTTWPAFAPMTDILAAVHVKAHVRLFMN